MNTVPGSENEKNSFLDTDQMSALIDSWATRFGALAVFEVFANTVPNQSAFSSMVFIAKAILCYYALQPLYHYFKIEKPRVISAKIWSWESIKMSVLVVAFVITLGLTFSPLVHFFDFLLTAWGVIFLLVLTTIWVVVFWRLHRRPDKM